MEMVESLAKMRRIGWKKIWKGLKGWKEMKRKDEMQRKDEDSLLRLIIRREYKRNEED